MTEQQEARLIELWKQDVSWTAMAEQLGITKNQVAHKCYKLGLRRTSGKGRINSGERGQPFIPELEDFLTWDFNHE